MTASVLFSLSALFSKKFRKIVSEKTDVSTGMTGKRKQMGSILLRYQPSVTRNPRAALKSTFGFTENVNEWKWKRETECHYVRFISQSS